MALTPIEAAAAAAYRANRAVAGKAVTYRRGDASVAVVAVAGRYAADVGDGNGPTVRTEVRDYLVAAADLVLGGAAVEPRGGDRIVEGDPATGTAFEVMDLPGEPCWRHSDAARTVLRIHTRHVGTMPLP